MVNPVHLTVIVVPYQPEWVQLFEAEKSVISAAIGPYLTNIEHIGSTSVPGMAAKPVIDILIGVSSLADSSYFIPPLEALNYIYVPEYENEFPERRYLKKLSPTAHTHHLHIFEPDSQFYQEHLHFRDLLRSHPELAEEYAALKYRLAEQYRNDRLSYTKSKSDFIQKALLLP